MIEHLLGQILSPDWQLQICFTGGSLTEMQAWLGAQFTYQIQTTGELGRRLQAEFQRGFESGYKRIIAIGADCPDLNSQLIGQAFQQLRSQDIVLGPAKDGGYYLIGLRRLHTAIFDGIDWGTSLVLQQTCKKAQHMGLSIAQLTVLSDVDRPEDLVVWEEAKRAKSLRCHDSDETSFYGVML